MTKKFQPLARGLSTIGMAAVVLAIASACAGSGDANPTDANPAEEITSITLSATVTAAMAPLFYAIDTGIFEKHGLDVTVQQVASPVPVVAALASGQAQIGDLTIPVLINSNREGTAVQCISPLDGQLSTEVLSGPLVASPEIAAEGLPGLSGKRIGVVQLSSVNAVGLAHLLAEAGVTDYEFVAVPFPQMPQSLSAGNIDAAVISSPFDRAAIENGAVAMANPMSEVFPNGTIYCYAATSDYIEANPDVVAAFRDAMTEVILFAGESEENVSTIKQSMVEHLSLTSEQAEGQVISSNWVPELNVDTIALIQNMMEAQGMIDSTFPVDQMIWSEAPVGDGR